MNITVNTDENFFSAHAYCLPISCWPPLALQAPDTATMHWHSHRHWLGATPMSPLLIGPSHHVFIRRKSVKLTPNIEKSKNFIKILIQWIDYHQSKNKETLCFKASSSISSCLHLSIFIISLKLSSFNAHWTLKLY